MNTSKGPRRISWQRVSLSVLCVFLALVLFVMIFATAYVHHLVGLVTGGDNSELFATLSSDELADLASDPDYDPNNTDPTINPDDVTISTLPSQPPEILQSEGIINIMLIGEDRRPGQGRQRSDSMILCSFNTKTNTITMISFLRDLYLPIPGHGSSRLNAAYSWGGVELLNSTLAQNFGASIDGNIEIDFYDFMALIDYLGGVTVELTEKEADYLNKNKNWDIEEDVVWNLTAGENLLTGSQALAYSRVRYIDSDFERTERQRTVLALVLEKLHALSWNELLEAMDMLLENSTMSFSQDELFLYTLGFYPVIADGEIVTARIPADDTWKYASVSGMSVIKADLDANAALLKQWLECSP